MRRRNEKVYWRRNLAGQMWVRATVGPRPGRVARLQSGERTAALWDVHDSVLPPVRRSEAVMPPSRVCGFLGRGAVIA